MTNRICCFFGHRDISLNPSMLTSLNHVLEDLVREHRVSEFWIGHYGSFDASAARCVKELKKAHPHIKLFLIIPYLTKAIISNERTYKQIYDGILVADIPLSTPKKFMISKCNRYIIDPSDYMVCCIRYSFGGAAKAVEYAKKKNLSVINLLCLKGTDP